MAKSLLYNIKAYRFAYRWYRRQDWLAARLLALSGYRVQREGLRFYVRTPGMTTDFSASFWFDRYETAERALVRKYVNPNHAIIELGGGIGMIACVVNQRLSYPANHIVVEANPALIEVMKRNKTLNKCQFQIICAAYSATQTQVTFQLGKYYTIGHVIPGTPTSEADEKTLVCLGKDLQRLIDEAGFASISLICDIEGSEYELIDQEAEVLREHVETLIVEMHSPPQGSTLADYIQRLNQIGFDLMEQAQHVYVFVKQPVRATGSTS